MEREEKSRREHVMNIAAVERDTRISKDTLRAWERRYRFPQPYRDQFGERLYPAAQVARLRVVKRLLDSGLRPGKIMRLDLDELGRLVAQAGSASETLETDAQSAMLLTQVRRRDALELREGLAATIARVGLRQFVTEILPRANVLVGDCWMRGELELVDEHLYSEQVERVVRASMMTLPVKRGHPHVVLTTVPHEEHRLGLLVVETLLVLEGVHCTSLGAQTPIADIVRAAELMQADIVGLSFSAAFSTSAAFDSLSQLRAMLPEEVLIWAGGSGIAKLRKADARILLLHTLGQMVEAADDWRRERGASKPSHPPVVVSP